MIRKVLHVIPSVAAVHGGPSVMVEMMAKGLSETGLEIHIATTNDDGAGKLNVPCGVPVPRGPLTYWYFDRQSRFYKYSGPLSNWLEKHVAAYQIVHIHALFSHAAVAAAHWARRRGVPYVVRPLGTLNQWGMQNRRPLLKNLSFRFIEKGILENAALIHYTSVQEREEASLLNVSAPSEIIPNPVPESVSGAASEMNFRARHPETRGREMILFLSRFDRKKGLELLLPAFATVLESFPAAALVLAGSGDPELVKELHAQAHQLGIAGSITWAGFLKGEEKQSAFAEADVFTLPSWSENFGIAVVEAMAAGCPVVVTDQVAIHGDITAARAGLVVPCNAPALAKALCRLLEDRPARAAMGFNGKCLTQTHYSLRAVTSRLVTAYNAIAN